ncbi:MAG: MFS transporter [Chloroflexi bacterium]|nr:MFS transporter [Chloroflexota bacterium]
MTSSYFSIFRVTGYRWLLGNALASSAAWTVEGLAQGWLVLTLTDSPFWLGVVVGVRGVSQTVCSILGGPLVDRLDRRKLLIVNNALASLLALGLAGLVLSDSARVWHVLLFVLAGGAIGALNGPSFNALTYDVVGPQRLLQGAAFRFMSGGLVRVFAALAGGYIIGLLGIGQSYVVVAAAYLLGAASLLPVRADRRPAEAKESPLRSLMAGVSYAFGTPPVRSLLFLSLMTEFFGFSYQYMKPVIARDALQVGAVGLGYLEAASALGSVAAMVGVSALGDFRRKGWLLLGGAFGFGLGIALFGLSPWYALSLPLAALVGGSGAVYDSTMSTVTQMTASAAMRGRVLGLYVATWGTNQLAGFGLGALGSVIGVPLALAMSGTVVAANAVRLLPKAGRLGAKT